MRPIVFALLMLIAMPAQAETYILRNAANGSVATFSTSSTTPFDLCAPGVAHLAGSGMFNPYGGTIVPSCALGWRLGSEATMILFLSRDTSTGAYGASFPIYNGATGAHRINSNTDCYGQYYFTIAPSTWTNYLSGAPGPGKTPGDFAASACAVCPDGESFNTTTNACEEDPCDEGEIWDTQINACREECDVDSFFFYDYSAGQCAAQCPAGKTANTALRTNYPVRVPDDGTVRINGCVAQVKELCHWDPDMDSATGWSCAYVFTYIGTIPEIITAQVVEDQGGAGYYTGEAGDSGEPTGVQFDGPVEKVALPSEEAAELQEQYYICQLGQPKMIVITDQYSSQVNMLGTCPSVNAGVEQRPGAQSAAAEKLQEVVDNQGEQNTLLAAIQEMLDNLNVSFSAFTGEGEGEEEGGCTGAECEIDPGEAGDPAEAEGLYARTQEDGLPGALADVPNLSADSDLNTFFNDLQPAWPTSVPACLAWDFELMFVGEIHFEPPCAIWDVIKVVLLGLTIAGAWSLIFVRRA
jgi:hypothetical protein